MSTAPVLALVGLTASGKSDAALRVARARVARGADPIEIVAADAFTVYRGMDVATAKPSPAARAEVRHHLIDELDPSQDTNVAWFQERARTVIEQVHERGHVPLLVGGSGLYFRAVVDPLRFPPTDVEVRAELEREHADAPRAAHARLAELDPLAAARIEPENLRRTVRALEVIELTGERFSDYDDGFDRYESRYPRLEVRGIDVPRERLRARIQERAERMVAQGLLAEAADLRDTGLSRTAEQAIGYAEAFAVLDGAASEDDLPTAIARRTWRYARRQLSWFRRDPRTTWSPADAIVEHWSG